MDKYMRYELNPGFTIGDLDAELLSAADPSGELKRRIDYSLKVADYCRLKNHVAIVLRDMADFRSWRWAETREGRAEDAPIEIEGTAIVDTTTSIARFFLGTNFTVKRKLVKVHGGNEHGVSLLAYFARQGYVFYIPQDELP